MDDYHDPREYAPDDYDVHEDCVSTEDAVRYVFDNHWDLVEEAAGDAKGHEWLLKTKSSLEILSIVSQRDRVHMRGAIKKWLRKKQTDTEELTDAQLFSIAADVSAFLEQQIPSPLSPAVHSYGPEGSSMALQKEPTAGGCMGFSARGCTLDGDLSWAKDLLVLSRAFRDFLSATSDPDLQESFLRLQIREPIRIFNSYLLKTPAHHLVYWWQQDEKQLRFGRCPDPKLSDMSSYIANWIADYLSNHYSYVGLGVCAECGKFFVRERRDKTFCSKTCQNRVAYNRRKILESGALASVVVAPDDACDIQSGLWMHHPRFGIGRIEAVGSINSSIFAAPHHGSGTDVERVRYKSMLSRRVMLQVRFLHGVRALKYSDLFEGEKKEEQVPTFYEVKSEETLAELL
ncbi:MAG: hypothetical protein AUH11_09220 [Acidobacteria bacterium 13_2_20CM_57_17]|nr:MAG: hypothetical protein AUH11_09220 [Acidobacteria bacterium 13_2_20CM_57_17]OLB91106.1 MAG: hypothetical protein AUI02_10195 [Acidobacteria bacterium 13_2_20CM_2_57_12]